MFDDVLIESSDKFKARGGWKTSLISFGLHVVILGAIVLAGMFVKEHREVIEKPIQAFVASAPPPPPPPPAGGAARRPQTPKPETPQVQQQFVQPTEVPDLVPEVSDAGSDAGDDSTVGGVEGGVPGGVVGGVVGGVIGGTLGGQLGGTLGGTGDRPVRVGGDVKPPTVITRVDPVYTEVARKARIQGIVILEAIIDAHGQVTDVRVIKPLPMGLDASAMDAVRKWKFKPGTLNGRPVPVIFNLTVNFRLQA